MRRLLCSVFMALTLGFPIAFESSDCLILPGREIEDPLRVEAFLPQQEFGRLSLGDTVVLLAETRDSASIDAMVERIDPSRRLKCNLRRSPLGFEPQS